MVKCSSNLCKLKKKVIYKNATKVQTKFNLQMWRFVFKKKFCLKKIWQFSSEKKGNIACNRVFFLHFGEISHLKKEALFHVVGNCGKNYKLKSRFWRLKKIKGICNILFFAKLFFFAKWRNICHKNNHSAIATLLTPRVRKISDTC